MKHIFFNDANKSQNVYVYYLNWKTVKTNEQYSNLIIIKLKCVFFSQIIF